MEKNHTSIVKILLATNPDLEITSSDGNTPLMKAVKNRKPEIVQMLLEKKAKVTEMPTGSPINFLFIHYISYKLYAEWMSFYFFKV